MSSIRELCNQLGFGVGGQFGVLTQSPFIRSAQIIDDFKYDPTEMLNKTRQFLKEHIIPSGPRATNLSRSGKTLSHDFKLISINLLTTDGFGPKYWPQSTASKPVYGYQWPQDQVRICDLLSQIMVHQVKNMNKRDKGKLDLADSDSDSTDLSLWSVSPTCSPSYADSGPRVKNNIVDLEDLEMESDGDTISVRSLNREELLSYEASGRLQHENHPLVFSTDVELIAKLQEWRKARNNIAPPGAERCKTAESVESESELIKVGDTETVTNSSSVGQEYMGWILKESNSQRLLVKVCPGGNPRVGFHCQGWLGGDRGFAEDLIAVSWNSGFLGPFFYPKLHPLRTQSRSTEKPRLLAQMKDTEEWSSTLNGRKQSRHTEPCTSYNLRKKTRKKTSIHQPKPKSALRSKPPHRTPVSQSKKRGGLNWQGLGTQSPITPNKSTDTSQAVPTIKPDSNLVDNLSSSDALTRKRLRSPTAETITLNTKQPFTSSARITLHFFLSDTNLGAIARPASACDSESAFFAAALAAYKITASNKQLEPSIVGVTVSWVGAERSIFILWGDGESFHNMMLTVTEAQHTGGEKVDVEVRCIVQKQ
ncbi:hypothetical protein MMC27_006636 [Xylographa pallens]|nr:hypothetical protein [Xylographa pallens]